MAVIVGTPGPDLLEGTPFNDLIQGLGGNDTLLGGNGNDTLLGGLGADSMVGGIGNDIFYVDNVNDIVVAGQGVDTVVSSINYTFNKPNRNDIENLILEGSAVFGTGNGGNNIIWGNILGNFLLGLAGSDTIFGQEGNDHIDGGIGNDFLYGQGGNDALIGDQGADTFCFADPAEEIDVIVDFNRDEGDRIGIAQSFGATNASQFNTTSDPSGDIILFFQGQIIATLQRPRSTFNVNTDIIFI